MTTCKLHASGGEEMLARVSNVVNATSSTGMYTPVTHDGTIVVDGMKHSVYTTHFRSLQPGGYFPARVFDMMWPEKNARMANRALFDDGHVFGSHAYLRWIARDLMGFLV